MNDGERIHTDIPVGIQWALEISHSIDGGEEKKKSYGDHKQVLVRLKADVLGGWLDWQWLIVDVAGGSRHCCLKFHRWSHWNSAAVLLIEERNAQKTVDFDSDLRSVRV